MKGWGCPCSPNSIILSSFKHSFFSSVVFWHLCDANSPTFFLAQIPRRSQVKRRPILGDRLMQLCNCLHLDKIHLRISKSQVIGQTFGVFGCTSIYIRPSKYQKFVAFSSSWSIRFCLRLNFLDLIGLTKSHRRLPTDHVVGETRLEKSPLTHCCHHRLRPAF